MIFFSFFLSFSGWLWTAFVYVWAKYVLNATLNVYKDSEWTRMRIIYAYYIPFIFLFDQIGNKKIFPDYKMHI